jgi:hypothetical protein
MLLGIKIGWGWRVGLLDWVKSLGYGKVYGED